MKHGLARLANRLYHAAPGVYGTVYSLYKRVSDAPERALMRSLVRPGMVALDVGANIGSSSLFLSRLVGPRGKVFSFEPEQENFVRLQRAVSGLENVQAVNKAVGDTTGKITLYVADDLNVDHRTYDCGGQRRGVAGQVTRLDDFFEPGAKIDFLKMDIQGFELRALLGARRILEENRAIAMVLEYWPYGLIRAGARPADLTDLLAQSGFSVSVVGREPPGGLVSLGEGEDDYVNLLASRPA